MGRVLPGLFFSERSAERGTEPGRRERAGLTVGSGSSADVRVGVEKLLLYSMSGAHIRLVVAVHPSRHLVILVDSGWFACVHWWG